jgi:predicted nucleic acid-binding Zn ribbon protein
MTLAEWARELGINYSTLRSRINRQGLSPEVALRTNSGSRDEKTGKFIGGYDID